MILNICRERYIKHEDFIKLCKGLGIGPNISVKQFEKELENYEKKGILYPTKRLIKPKDYVKFFFDLQHNPKNPQYRKSKFEYPKEFAPLYELVDSSDNKLGKFNRGEGGLIHPFDIKDEDYQSFLENPIEKSFKEWREYEIIAGRLDYGGNRGNIGTKEIKMNTAIHYYSYWQAYQVFEILEFKHTITTVSKGDEIFNQLLKILKDYTPQLDEMLAKVSEIQFQSERRTEEKGGILGINRQFDALSFYIQMREKEYLIAFQRLPEDKLVLEDRDYEELQERNKKHAKFVFDKFNLNEGELYKFAGFLVDKYFEYKRLEKTKLSESVKKDIGDLIEFILYVTNKEVEEIKQYTRTREFTRKHPLDIIFPDDLEEAKKESICILNTFIDDYNNKFQSGYRIQREDIEELINYSEDNGLFIFLYTLPKINKAWFGYEFKDLTSLFIGLRDLSTFFEGLIKNIGKKNEVLKENFGEKEKLTLKDAIYIFFNGEDWINTIENCQISFKGKDKRLKEMARFDARSGFNDFKEKIDYLLKNKIDSQNDSIIRCLLISWLIRNFTSHEINLPPIETFGSYYIEIIRPIIYSIFFTWVYSKKRTKDLE